MNLRRHLLEAATLVVAAVLCALVANALASRERKLALVGSYPNALKVPENGAEGTAPAPLASKGGAPASGKLPFEEKHPGPSEKPTPKAAVQTQESEAKNLSSSPADLLRRFPPHNKPFVEISGDDVARLF
ncbi:MAG TPA: hypothetical protein VF395_19070, partial [Polyangiaceae bacterium]